MEERNHGLVEKCFKVLKDVKDFEINFLYVKLNTKMLENMVQINLTHDWF